MARLTPADDLAGGGGGRTTVGGQWVPAADPPTAAPFDTRPAATPSRARHARQGKGRRTAVTPAGTPDPPLAVTGQYLPALDGLRALAVAGVLAYHLGFGWMSGGYLGVDLFFVLSGFLITSLLLEEWVTTTRIRLGAFWARRARRLLPALLLVLVALCAYVVLDGRFGPPGSAAQVDLSALRGDALATLFYVANWHSIFAHQSYFAQFSAPSPLQHTWSLAIEEQFYLVWPPLLLLILTLAKGRWRRIGAVVTVCGALLSAGLMALLYHGGDPTRVYFGTDTHAFDMLAGATIAMVAAARPQPGPSARKALHLAAPVAIGGLGVCWVVAGTPTQLPRSWMFHGGFLLCAVLAALVVADVRQFHQGPLGTVLSIQPLRWIGTISYGIYLWHWPIFVYLNGERTGWGQPWLDLARVGLTLVVATASYYLVERPIRQHRLHGWPRFALAPIAAVVTAAIVVVATVPAVAAPQDTAHSATAHAVKVGGAATVAGTGGAMGQKIALPAFGPSDPLRVTVMGDSQPYVAEPGIAAALGATGEVSVSNIAFPGWGLTDTTLWQHPTEGISQLLSGDHTQLVLAAWSWDDSCTPAHPTGLVHRWTYDCALQHPAAYKKILQQAVNLILGPGGATGIIFLQLPTQGPDAEAGETPTDPALAQAVAGQHAWQSIVQSLTTAYPGKVMFLPVGSSVLLDGKYTPWLPTPQTPRAPKSQWLRVRMVDGIHMCPAGVVRYADAVLADLTTLYDLSPARGTWPTQSWTTTPKRFDTPVGSCPDDHP